ncbi:MAG: hypothetical protein M0P55_03605 [Clostridiales bacterium]|nr:hypothetical protein [Clostridiales bacterium]
MARPSQSAAVADSKKDSRYTKAAITARKAAEKALATGKTFTERPEVKHNPVAHAEFERLEQLLSGIGKNDAIYEAVINRYCIIFAECLDFGAKRDEMHATFNELRELLHTHYQDCDIRTYRGAIRDLNSLSQKILEYDRQIENKRKMLLAIEKENIMTVSAALRTVPKKPDKPENPLLKVLDRTD